MDTSPATIIPSARAMIRLWCTVTRTSYTLTLLALAGANAYDSCRLQSDGADQADCRDHAPTVALCVSTRAGQGFRFLTVGNDATFIQAACGAAEERIQTYRRDAGPSARHR